MEAEERYSISELADAASVSVRTVRYYIGEGLLPPAVTAGSRSYYTRAHLDRLGLIARMKEGFLPLREIRKQLGELDDATIRELAVEKTPGAPEKAKPRVALPLAHILAERSAPPEGAVGFIAGREDIRPSAPERKQSGSASSYIASVLRGSNPRSRTPWTYSSLDVPRTIEVSQSAEPEPIDAEPPTITPAAEPAAWRRIEIGDGAELLIREDAYQRRRDKVDWLIDWARKVLD